MEQLSFDQLNLIDLVDYLASIGIQPKKRRANHYYYLSPLAGHPEHRPTFIVNRHLNRWRETTTRQAGNLSDLAIQLYDCTIGELTTILRAALPPVPQTNMAKHLDQISLVNIEQTQLIRSGHLERYLWDRRIPLHVARYFCLEASYKRGENLYTTLAFPSDAGGFELFDNNHHYRVPPCGPTHIGHQSESIAVFRHVLDLLSYVTLFAGPIHHLPDLLILNAPIPFLAVQEILVPYKEKHLFLPNDASGALFTTVAMRAFDHCYDQRYLYKGYAGLNDWLCHIGMPPSLYNAYDAQQPPPHPGPAAMQPKKPKNAPPR